MSTKTCRDCGLEFNPKGKIYKGGFVDQCNECSRKTGDAEKRYLGRPGATNKGANITIFRTDLKFVKSVLRREGRIGYNANLGLNSSISQSAKEDELK